MNRAKNATLVFCLFVLYCVLLSQGLRANAASTFFGALAAVPLTVHLYNRIWPLPRVGEQRRSREFPARCEVDQAATASRLRRTTVGSANEE